MCVFNFTKITPLQVLFENFSKFLRTDTFKNSFVTITINNFIFVEVIQHLRMLEIVFTPKKLIKVNDKPSRMNVSKDIFQQSFKFHDY